MWQSIGLPRTRVELRRKVVTRTSLCSAEGIRSTVRTIHRELKTNSCASPIATPMPAARIARPPPVDIVSNIRRVVNVFALREVNSPCRTAHTQILRICELARIAYAI